MGILLGFAPWIIFWILASNDTFLVAILAAAASSLIINARQVIRRRLKVLEIGTLLFFGVMSLAALSLDPAWLERWVHVLGNASLTTIALVSILIGRPFTLQYAREQIAEEYWETPRFMTTNLIITWVWTASFILQTLSSTATLFWPHHETWFSWLIPTASFVAAIKFTVWYPEQVRARAAGVS